jgi:hypothetical protein
VACPSGSSHDASSAADRLEAAMDAFLDRECPEWAAEHAAEPNLLDQTADELQRGDQAARAYVRRHGYRETFNNMRRRPLRARRRVRPCNRRRGAGRPSARRTVSRSAGGGSRGDPHLGGDGDDPPGEHDLVATRSRGRA